jgi:hypothetical protein
MYVFNENIIDRFADAFYLLSKINVSIASANHRNYEWEKVRNS